MIYPQNSSRYANSTMTNTIDIMLEILDNISDKWKEEKIFIYGQGTDVCSDPTHAF